MPRVTYSTTLPTLTVTGAASVSGTATFNGAVNVTGQLTGNAATPFKWGSASGKQATVGPAGAAAALPATPATFLKVTDSANTALVIPAYAAS